MNGVLMAAAQLNQDGGINGRRIDVVIEDDRGSPEEAARKTAKLIDQDKVVAIIAGGTSGNSSAAAPKAQSSRIPLISPSSTDPAVTQAAFTANRGFDAILVCATETRTPADIAHYARTLGRLL